MIGSLKELFETLSRLGNQQMSEIGYVSFLVLMLISFLSSAFISYLYLVFYQNRATGSRVHRSFPLLGISITAIFICIQFSLPLSLGLLGALSIVRFRTPIKEPEEIGFIMLVIAASICVATFSLFFLGILMTVAVGVLLIMRGSTRFFKGRLNDGMLIITIPTGEYQAKGVQVLDFLQKKLPGGRIDSIAENQEESTLSYSFIRMDKSTALELKSGLQKIVSEVKSNLFFNRSGEV